MKSFGKIIAILLIICLILPLCSCSGGSNERIYVSLGSMPRTLDPQSASSDSELLIARNIYEGLTRRDNNGNIVLAACESYDFSNLTYTFTLKDGIKWSDGEPITADDFVFGIKRALLPETEAPFAGLLYAIKGAAAVSGGNAAADTLGISAPDSKTVKIELEYDDKNFLETLSMPVSMPCREDFFYNSIGRYGLQKDNVLCSGSYKLARWNKEGNGIRLYVNEQYKGDFKPKNGGVFIAKDKEKTEAEKLTSGEADIALLPSKYLADIENKDIKQVSVENICWVLSLGGELSEGIKKAFCMCYSYDTYSADLPYGFTVAQSFIPGVFSDGETGSQGKYGIPYDPDAARSVLAVEIQGLKNKKFPQTTLVYYESEQLRPAITAIVGDWQNKLVTFVNIKATDKSLEGELKSHTQSLCAFPVKADSSLADYLSKFGITYEGDPAGVNSRIAARNNLIPIAFENTTFGYLKNISEVYISAVGGYIDFSYVVKK